MRDASVVELLDVLGDGRELLLVNWQSVLRRFPHSLIEKDSFHLSFLLKLFAEQRLVPVVLD